MELHSGVWTIVFTDMVDSTAQRSRLGDAKADELRRKHDEIVSNAVRVNGGVLVKSTGDGSMCAFVSAVAAVDAAITVIQDLERLNRRAAEPLTVRIGLSLGEVSYEAGDLYGLPVVEAARLCALALPGRVVATDLVRAVCAARSRHVFSAIGSFDLKGISDPVGVWRVDRVPLAATTRPPLPAILTTEAAIAFCGRDRELGKGIDAFEAALSGERRVIVVAGEPGIGKTRLTAEVAQHADGQGALVLYGRCDAEPGLPFQPFAEALEWYLRSVEGHHSMGEFPSDLARLAPAVAQHLPVVPMPLDTDPDTEQYRLFEAVRTWLSSIADDLPVVLILDDLHWATRPTLLMLRHLLRDVHLGRVLVLATYRETDIDRAHPLSGILAEVHKLGGIEHLRLAGLDAQGIGVLLTQESEQPLDDQLFAFARTLLAETNGNPFFLGEILRHLSERGVLNRQQGRWALDAAFDESGIPQSIKDVLAWRLGRLDSATVEALEVAAVIGRDFDVNVLIEVSGLADATILAAIEQAEPAGLVAEAGDDEYRFSHALVRGVLLDQLARARRIRLHRRIADALELRAGTNPASLAYHWYEARSARDDDKAIAASMAAGDAAMDQFAFLEAASHFDRALELLEPTADAHAALHCDLLLRAGGARAASGEYARAREAYMQCGRFAQLHSLNDKLVAAGLGLLRPRQSRRAIDPRELTVVEAAYDVCPSDDAATRSQLAARRAALLHEGSDERRRWGAQALALARGSGSDRALRLALSEQAWNMFRADAMDEQLRLTAEVAELARRSGSHEAVLEATTLQFVPAAITGCFDEVDHLREQLEAESLRIGHRYYLALATLGRAAHHAWRGHLDEADRDCAAAIAACQEPELVEAWRGTFFQVRQLGGRLEEIEPVLRGGLRDPDAPMDALWSLARTVTFATVGDIAEAKAEYQVVCPNGVAALSPAGSRIQFLELAWFAEAASLLGDGTCGEQLHRELRPWDGLHCYPSPAVNAGPVSLFLGMLERVMGHHEEAEHHLEDTIVLCDTIGAAAAGGIARTELLLLFEARGTARDAARAEHVRKEIDECVENYGLDGVARRLEVIRASS